jgi:transposase
MAHIHKKMKKGRPYYYVRETARVNGKPKVVNQVYLGSLERIMEMAAGIGGEIKKLQVQEYGSLLIGYLIEKEIDIAAIVDDVVGGKENQDGPSVGDYFFYAILNRMIDAKSKRALPEWYKSTAIQHVRPVRLDALSSRHYWRAWEKVSEAHIKEIAERFFAKLVEQENVSSDCFLFDTTNYYTYMASSTESDLAKRGKNKEGKNWLRQVGLALLVSSDEQLPLYYHEYEGNRHDSKVFLDLLDDVAKAMHKRVGPQTSLTIAFDKGMNAFENITILDGYDDIHFITSYSTAYAQDLVKIKMDQFIAVDTETNKRLAENGKEADQLLAWRTTGEYWGAERTVVVTYNPRTATKQRYNFEKKLLKLQQHLFEMQSNVQANIPHWRDKAQIMKRYEELCGKLYIPKDLYKVELYKKDSKLRMNFRKNHHRLKTYIARFGKNILITDRHDWSTDDIVKLSLDRYKVEKAFRQTKDDDLVSLMPLYHWTDSKIRCHILCCVVALAYIRLIERKLSNSGVEISAKTAMETMHTLHSCLVYHPRKRNPQRLIEDPTKSQAQILKAFGLKISSGVLQGS